MLPCRKKVVKGVSLLPCLIVAGLLIPGNSWAVKELRTFCSLITVLILPGYALARFLRLFDLLDNWLNVLLLSVALSWSIGLVLWLLFFFLGVPLKVVSLTWLLLTGIGLVASAFVSLPNRLVSWPSRPLLVVGVVVWIGVVTGATYLYGGLLVSDSYSYMTWLRNVRVGDIGPYVNLHASWEANYPHFKNIYAPTFFYYAMCSFLGHVDPNWVWTHAPTVWVPIMLAVQFSLAHRIFKRKAIGYAALFLFPLAGRGPFAPRIGGPRGICNAVLLPLAWWLYLQAVFGRRKLRCWAFPVATLVAASLTFEHLPHIIHFLLVAGAFTVFSLLSRGSRDVFWRSMSLIVVVLLFIAPFLWHTWQLASARQFDAHRNMIDKLQGGIYFLGNERFFIVNPSMLFRPLNALAAVLTIGYIRNLWQRESVRLAIASLSIVAFIGLNPFLTPFLSSAIAPQVTFRLWEALVIFPVLVYGVTRAIVLARAFWRHRRKAATAAITLLVVFSALVAHHQFRRTFKAINDKMRNVIYSPANVSTNLSDRLIRRIVASELESPPYPILDPPAQLTRYLDAETLAYIREEIPSDSVFLSERLTEYNLPAYADQLAYLARPGWPSWGEVCPRIRANGAESAFPTIPWPEVHHRLDIACGIMNPGASSNEIRLLLAANQAEIDYILVTPNIAYLKPKLAQIMFVTRVYTNDDFIIYTVENSE